MTDIPIRWEIEVPPDQMEQFIALVQGLGAKIDPGDSLKEVCVIPDNALASKIQSLAGVPYQQGQHSPEGVTVPIEQENSLSSTILIRQAIFTQSEIDPLALLFWQISTIVEELLHCRIYHQTWQRRGYINSHTGNFYLDGLLTYCGQMHDEYAVARLKNMLFGELKLHDDNGQYLPPYFIEYGVSLTACFDQASQQLQTNDIFQVDPIWRKGALLPIAYRFIFEPLARHAGFLVPIPPDYPLLAIDNKPETSAFYREVVAPYWIPIKSALESSFDSQFSKTEEELRAMSETMDTCLDRLLKMAINAKR